MTIYIPYQFKSRLRIHIDELDEIPVVTTIMAQPNSETENDDIEADSQNWILVKSIKEG